MSSKLPKSDSTWVETELFSANFDEKRINKRFQTIARELAERPSFPINQASTDWAATKAAYRFFENTKVSCSAIFSPHLENTKMRMEGHKKVIIAQDSSTVDFSRHKTTEGLGELTKFSDGGTIKGLLVHSALAMTEKGVPLGLTYHKIWPRLQQKKKGHDHTKIPIHQKESFKWIKGLRESAALKGKDTELIVVCDREADIYELFEEAIDLEVGLVVRLQHNRVIHDEKNESFMKIHEHLSLVKPCGKVEVIIPSSGSRVKRTAEMKVSYSSVTLTKAPRNIETPRTRRRTDLQISIVELAEKNPKEGHSPLHWILLTTLPITSFEEAKSVMGFYKLRWNIELFFKTLKSGCNVEDCRLNAGDKLMKYITLLSIIAWRLHWMTFLNRAEPDASCETILTPSEWKALWLKHHKKQIKAKQMKPIPPDTPLTVREAIRWIAMEGGFLGRKGDKEPGIITLWKGWLELGPAVEMWELLNGMF